MTLTEFLLARVADSPETISLKPFAITKGEVRPARQRSTRVGIAHRRIVERLRWVDEHPEWAHDMEIAGQWEDAHATLCDLATVYADHPDYQEEWKP